MTGPQDLAPELWGEVVEILLCDDTPVPVKDDLETTLGHSAVESLGSVNQIFYSLTRRHVWHSIVVSPNTVSQIAQRAAYQPQGVNGATLGSFIKKIEVRWTQGCDEEAHSFFSVLDAAKDLQHITISSWHSSIPSSHTHPLPEALFDALREYQPPLRRVDIHGGCLLPSVSQINALLGAISTIDYIVLGGCIEDNEGEEDGHLESLLAASRSRRLRRLELCPPGDNDNGLAHLARMVALGGVDSLEAKGNVAIEAWLQRFGPTLDALTCRADAFVIPKTHNLLVASCGRLLRLELHLVLSGQGPTRLPSGVQLLKLSSGITHAEVPSRLLALHIEDFFANLEMDSSPNLQTICLDVAFSDMRREWLDSFEGICHTAGIALVVNPTTVAEA